jgi:hypothetical protein
MSELRDARWYKTATSAIEKLHETSSDMQNDAGGYLELLEKRGESLNEAIKRYRVGLKAHLVSLGLKTLKPELVVQFTTNTDWGNYGPTTIQIRLVAIWTISTNVVGFLQKLAVGFDLTAELCGDGFDYVYDYMMTGPTIIDPHQLSDCSANGRYYTFKKKWCKETGKKWRGVPDGMNPYFFVTKNGF